MPRPRYKKAGIVRRPKQREGWKLKKWEAWEHELSKAEKLWSNIHQEEHAQTASTQSSGVLINDLLPLLPHILDGAIRQQISMQINQIFPKFPEQRPRPLRRLNWVEQKLDLENLLSHGKNSTSIMKATSEARDSIISMLRSAIENLEGASSSNAGVFPENHSEGDDTMQDLELRLESSPCHSSKQLF